MHLDLHLLDSLYFSWSWKTESRFFVVIFGLIKFDPTFKQPVFSYKIIKHMPAIGCFMAMYALKFSFSCDLRFHVLVLKPEEGTMTIVELAGAPRNRESLENLLLVKLATSQSPSGQCCYSSCPTPCTLLPAAV